MSGRKSPLDSFKSMTRSFHPCQKRTVLFIGLSGAGKSSLLSNFMQFQRLAKRTATSTKSCQEKIALPAVATPEVGEGNESCTSDVDQFTLASSPKGETVCVFPLEHFEDMNQFAEVKQYAQRFLSPDFEASLVGGLEPQADVLRQGDLRAWKHFYHNKHWEDIFKNQTSRRSFAEPLQIIAVDTPGMNASQNTTLTEAQDDTNMYRILNFLCEKDVELSAVVLVVKNGQVLDKAFKEQVSRYWNQFAFLGGQWIIAHTASDPLRDAEGKPSFEQRCFARRQAVLAAMKEAILESGCNMHDASFVDTTFGEMKHIFFENDVPSLDVAFPDIGKACVLKHMFAAKMNNMNKCIAGFTPVRCKTHLKFMKGPHICHVDKRVTDHAQTVVQVLEREKELLDTRLQREVSQLESIRADLVDLDSAEMMESNSNVPLTVASRHWVFWTSYDSLRSFDQDELENSTFRVTQAHVPWKRRISHQPDDKGKLRLRVWSWPATVAQQSKKSYVHRSKIERLQHDEARLANSITEAENQLEEKRKVMGEAGAVLEHIAKNANSLPFAEYKCLRNFYKTDLSVDGRQLYVNYCQAMYSLHSAMSD